MVSAREPEVPGGVLYSELTGQASTSTFSFDYILINEPTERLSLIIYHCPIICHLLVWSEHLKVEFKKSFQSY